MCGVMVLAGFALVLAALDPGTGPGEQEGIPALDGDEGGGDFHLQLILAGLDAMCNIELVGWLPYNPQLFFVDAPNPFADHHQLAEVTQAPR